MVKRQCTRISKDYMIKIYKLYHPNFEGYPNMLYLIFFIFLCGILPAIMFTKLFLEYREDKTIGPLCLLDILGFVFLTIFMLSYYVPFLNSVSDIGTDKWYAEFITSERGEGFRLK